ncbi:MAG: DUF4931 domain-containing protein [bacterium]|nr:DUF4931 domain-containing protein [bacterium]
MAKFVPDIKTKRWVVISPHRVGRPGADEIGLKGEKKVCPFCSGNEKLTPPEVFRVGEGETDKPGWRIRVVPNKFPITDTHEVIIHSPDHQKDIETLTHHEVVNLFKVYRERFLVHDKDGQVIIFCNHGRPAGASLDHPHSQLVVIPQQINLDALSLEPACNIVKETDYFIAYCPDFSQWPYEVWMVPKIRIKNQELRLEESVERKFGEINDREIENLVQLLQQILRQLRKLFPDLYYNYYIYPGDNWYLRIIPRLVDRAGFELGTGLSVNIKDPTEAARELKD